RSPTDIVGRARLGRPLDQGKAVVDASRRVTIPRLSETERALSDKMTMQDVAELFRGEMDPSSVYTVEEKEYESVWGKQHIDVLTNFAAHINHGTPLIADGAEGINGVRLASGMQLSAWTGREIDLVDYPAEEYLAELN